MVNDMASMFSLPMSAELPRPHPQVLKHRLVTFFSWGKHDSSSHS